MTGRGRWRKRRVGNQVSEDGEGGWDREKSCNYIFFRMGVLKFSLEHQFLFISYILYIFLSVKFGLEEN